MCTNTILRATVQVLFKAMYRTWTAAETVDEEDVRWFYMAKCGDWHLFEVGFTGNTVVSLFI